MALLQKWMLHRVNGNCQSLGPQSYLGDWEESIPENSGVNMKFSIFLPLYPHVSQPHSEVIPEQMQLHL